MWLINLAYLSSFLWLDKWLFGFPLSRHSELSTMGFSATCLHHSSRRTLLQTAHRILEWRSYVILNFVKRKIHKILFSTYYFPSKMNTLGRQMGKCSTFLDRIILNVFCKSTRSERRKLMTNNTYLWGRINFPI